MTQRIRRKRLILLFTIWIGGACAGDRSSDVIDLNVVQAELRTRIGTRDGPEETLLGRVTSVAGDAQGRIYVADALGSDVRVFDPAGEFLAYVGERGEGPGEFSTPYDVAAGEGGLLFVRDLSRVTAFVPTTAGGVPDSVLWTARIPGYGISWSRRGGTDRSRYFYPADSDNGYIYLVVDSSGFRSDTLWVPDAATMRAHRTAFVRMSGGVDGFMMPGLAQAPFEPAAEWDITAQGTVVFADGESYRLVEVGTDGDTIRSWSGPREPRAVPADERGDSARAVEARIDSLPVPIEDVRNASSWLVQGVLPDSLPGAVAVHVSPHHDVWVRQWPGPGEAGKSIFDVFSREGSYLRTVVVPAELRTDPPPFVSDSKIVGVVVDPETDIEFVVVFEEPS